MRGTSRRWSAFLLATLPAACAGEGGDEDWSIRENVVVVDEGGGPQLRSREGDRFVFSAGGPGGRKLAAGDIVVGTSEDGGFLRRVESVAAQGEEVVAETSQAAFVDAVERGTLDARLSLSGGTGSRRNPLTGGLECLEQNLDLSLGIDLSGTVLYSGEVGGAEVVLDIPTGRVVFDPDVDIHAEVAWGGLEEFSTIARGRLTFEVEGRLQASAAFSHSDEVELYSISKTFVQWIGYFPVVEVVTLSILAGYEANAEARGRVQSGFDSTAEVVVGARYQDGDWEEVWEPSFELKGRDPIWDASGSVGVRVYVKPEMRVDFYAVAGPYLSVEPYLDYQAEISLADWSWELAAGLEGDLGFQVQILDWSLADFNTKLVDLRRPLLSDHGRFGQQEPEEPPAEVEGFLDAVDLDALSHIGLTVHPGGEPPNLDGSYRFDTLVIRHDDGAPHASGTPVDPLVFHFLDQDAEGRLRVAFEVEGGATAGAGDGAFISGGSDCFSVFVDSATDSGNCRVAAPMVLSGCVSGRDISDFEWALIFKDRSGGVDCRSVPDEGLRRLIAQDGGLGRRL